MLKYDNEINNYIHALEKEGITLSSNEGKIKYKCEKGALPKEHLEIIKNNKQEIIDFLENAACDKVPLTSIQYAYLLGKEKSCELGGISSHYYIEYELEDINVEKLGTGINKLIDSCDALRMVIKKDGNMIFLRNTDKYQVEQYELSENACEGAESARLKVRQIWQHKDYEVGTWPMFHFAVGKAADSLHKDVLHISFDCMILDAFSAKLMVEKLFALYEDREITIPKLSFKEYMTDIPKNNDEKALDYWKEQIETLPEYPHLQLKKQFNDVSVMDFKRIEHSFTKEETEKLYEKSKKKALTPASVICLLFMKTLSESSTNKDVAVNVTLFNRRTTKEWGNSVNEILGEFTNNAVIRYEDTADEIIASMKETQKQFWNLLRYRDFEGSKILGMISNGAIGKAVMPVVYTCMLGSGASEEEFGFKEVYSLSQTPQVMIDHHVRDDLGYLKISWDYVQELFDKEYLEEIFEGYVGKIEDFIRLD